MTLSPDDGRRTKPNQAIYTKACQKAFLGAFSLSGTIRTAADSTNLSRFTVDTWNKKDIHGFRAQFQEAQESFGDYLEDIALERIKLQKPSDNPILLITFLNANKPDKYRRDASYVDNAGKEIIAELKKLRKENARSKRAAAPTEETEAETDQKQAVEEAQKILARKHGDTDSTG
jgi:hypothetical protein